MKKHNKATDNRRFNAILATSSINDAIKYFNLFKSIQEEKQAKDEEFVPLNIVCVFSPTVQVMSGNNDIKQFQEDLTSMSLKRKKKH